MSATAACDAMAIIAATTLAMRTANFSEKGERTPQWRPPRFPHGCFLLCRSTRHLLLQLLLKGRHIEARTLLHGRILKEGLRCLRDFLLNEGEAPELEAPPVARKKRLVQARALERIKPDIDQDWPVDLDRAAEPAVWLISEPVLVVADTDCAEGAFGEIKDFVALRFALASDQVGLVVAVKIHPVIPVADLLALLELVGDVRIAGRSYEGWEPVEPRHELVLDLACGHPARPTDDRRHAEAALERRSLAAGERRLATIRPGEVLGAIVSREGKDRVVLEPIVLEVFHDRTDDVVELRHSGFLDRPPVLRRAHVLVLLREMREHVHAGRIEPEEKRLAVLSCLVEELERIRQ